MGKVKSDSRTSPCYHFKLFVAGNEPNSEKASAVVKSVCRTYLASHYKLEIIDVYKDYQAAIDNRIIAVPALIVNSPGINTTVIGSLDSAEALAKLLSLI